MTEIRIEIELDEQMLDDLDSLAARESRDRSALIKDACARFLREMDVDEEELDRQYAEGYRRFPESTELVDAMLPNLRERLAENPW